MRGKSTGKYRLFLTYKLFLTLQTKTIPKIFELAADYINSEHRIVGTSALAAIDSFNRNKARLQPVAIKDSRQR